MTRTNPTTFQASATQASLQDATPHGISIYHGDAQAAAWLKRFQGQPWQLEIALAFTETALIPGISAAGKTAGDRQFTAHADAEFLHSGLTPSTHPPSYPLPPLTTGLSPVLISRAMLEASHSKALLINTGLAHPLNLPSLDLAQPAAHCLSSGAAMSYNQAQQSFQKGLSLGETWPNPTTKSFTATQPSAPTTTSVPSYAVLGECVVGGTTTALGLLMGLGVDALGRVNSSHGQCNHQQKAQLVTQGLAQAGLGDSSPQKQQDPLKIVAALGDPMQPFLAGYAIALSRHQGVLLAGGTQMLAVYALATAITQHQQLPWQPKNIAIGTTRWVATDPTGDTPGLAKAIEQRFGLAPLLLATDLSFAASQHSGLRAYEEGFVKEGVGAGGCAIATTLSLGWSAKEIAESIETFVTRYSQWRSES